MYTHRKGGGVGTHRYPQRKGEAGIHRIGTGTHIERGQVHIEGPGMLAIDYKPDL